MTNNNGLTFPDSVAHNIQWIKKLSEEHDCSQGLVAAAALMTMHMMDSHNINLRISKMEQEIATIVAAVCPSNS